METSHSQTPWLTRRTFLGTAAGIVASAYVLPLIPPGSPAVPTVWAATDFKLRAPEPNPKYGGVLRYGITSTPPHFDIHQSVWYVRCGALRYLLVRRLVPDEALPGAGAGWHSWLTLGAQTMDPILEGRAPHAHYQAPVFDSLVGFDYDKGRIGPGVAERWELNAAGSAWTFFLRSGLKCHNGDPLTAHDVKFSLERTMSPESVSSQAAALRRNVERIEVLDDRTVRVYTKQVQPYVPESLSRAVFQEGQLMPKKYIETVGTVSPSADASYALRGW